MILKKKILFMVLQIKMAFQLAPRILAGTLGFALLIGLLAFAGAKVLEADNQNASSFNVGLVTEDDSKYTHLALKYLFEEETVKEMCNFIEMTNDDAVLALKKGKVACVIIIPENFLASILNGQNIPARIILPEGGTSSQSKYFREMVQAAADDLGIAQSAVYAIEDYCEATGATDAIGKAEDYMNQTLLTFALRRNSYIVEEIVSVTGEFSITIFYISSGIVLLLLLSGITCNELLQNENAAYNVCMQRQGIGKMLVLLAKLKAIICVYFALALLIYVVAVVLGKVPFSVVGVLGIAVCIFAAFAIGQFAFVVTGQRLSGAMFLFLGTVVMMFVAGCFLPDVFLPNAVVTIGKWMPARHMVNLCGQIIKGSVQWANIGKCTAFALMFFAASCLVASFRTQRDR